MEYKVRVNNLADTVNKVEDILELYQNILKERGCKFPEGWQPRLSLFDDGKIIIDMRVNLKQSEFMKLSDALPLACLLRKWEAIAEVCRMRGLPVSAKIAETIDELLIRIYPDYLGDLIEVNLHRLVNNFGAFQMFIKSSENCIGCRETQRITSIAHETPRDCKKCKFAKIAGMCADDKTSLYNVFINTLMREEAER